MKDIFSRVFISIHYPLETIIIALLVVLISILTVRSDACRSSRIDFSVDASHGMPGDGLMHQHVGDLGNIESDATGKAYMGLDDRIISLDRNKTTNVIGLPLMIHNLTDDGGHTGKGESSTTG